MKADLNSRLRVGDADAFEDIFKLTHPRLLSYCRLFVPDLSLSDDLVQECFMSLWEKRKTIKPNQSVESLLFVMLRHRCLNYLRDNKFLHSETDIQNVKEVDLQHLFELDFTGIERKSIEEELIDAITVEIEKLPEKRKEVFVKSKIEGLKNKEVAEQLGISIKTVEKHLKQAKEQIRQAISDKYVTMALLIAVILK